MGEILGPYCKKIDISHTAPHLQRNRYNNLFHSRNVNEEKQALLLPQRPGYQDSKTALVDMHKQERQDCGVPLIPKVEKATRAKSARSFNAKVSWVAWAFVRLNILRESDSSRHLPLLGHQVRPGGLRPPGLRTGIKTNGKTVRGLKSGKMRQHRLTFSRSRSQH